MSEPTLLEAHERFAAALEALRRKLLNEFESWLKPALGRDLGTAYAEASERKAAARRRLAQGFIDEAAPALIRSLNRDAERDVLEALRSYEARFEPQPERAAPLAERPWQAGVWRTAIGAAFGAVVGVLVLAIGHVGSAPFAQPATTQQQVAPAPPTAPGPNPQASPQVTPPPVELPPMLVTASAPVLWLLAAFAAALGAAIGAALVACPPVAVMMQRAGLRGGALTFVQKFGKTFGGIFLLLRGSAVIALAAVLLSGFFGVLAWLFSGAKFSQVLFGLMALATILAARWTAPGDRASDRDALQQSLLDRLDQHLRADAQLWASLAAALVLRPAPHAASRDLEPARRLKEVVDIIESRRQLEEPGETILQILEQNLGLRSGPRVPAPPAQPGEFVWQRQHAEAYSTFGVVEVGDVVRVTQRPLFIAEPDGTQRVSQKGVVTRKA